VVKPGAIDPDYGYDLTGWQGRVVENHYVDEQNNPCVTIAWDSITLKQMPVEMIERCEEDGLDWSSMGLYAREVQPASPRDKIHQVQRVKAELEEKHQMDHLGESQERGPITTGERVSVLDIEIVDDSYGIIVSIKTKRGHYDFPICDLEALPAISPNYQPLNDYVVWFANR
jgi:hypothetical protein